MPAVRGDGMRGLAVFISDIRNCKSKEAEIKRINKELANIRNKFKVFCLDVSVSLDLLDILAKSIAFINLSLTLTH